MTSFPDRSNVHVISQIFPWLPCKDKLPRGGNIFLSVWGEPAWETGVLPLTRLKIQTKSHVIMMDNWTRGAEWMWGLIVDPNTAPCAPPTQAACPLCLRLSPLLSHVLHPPHTHTVLSFFLSFFLLSNGIRNGHMLSMGNISSSTLCAILTS